MALKLLPTLQDIPKRETITHHCSHCGGKYSTYTDEKKPRSWFEVNGKLFCRRPICRGQASLLANGLAAPSAKAAS